MKFVMGWVSVSTGARGEGVGGWVSMSVVLQVEGFRLLSMGILHTD